MNKALVGLLILIAAGGLYISAFTSEFLTFYVFIGYWLQDNPMLVKEIGIITVIFPILSIMVSLSMPNRNKKKKKKVSLRPKEEPVEDNLFRSRLKAPDELEEKLKPIITEASQNEN